MDSSFDLEKAFKDFGRQIYAFVFLRIGTRQAAEDIVQEAFMKAWRSRETFNSEKSNMKNWLFAIARNTLFDKLNEKREKECIGIDEELESDEDIEKNISKKLLIDNVFSKLKQLSAKQQELLILRYRLDFSLPDISKITSLTISDVKVSIHRAIKKLTELCKNKL